jgi:GYD domain
MESFYFGFGDADAYVTVDLPDNAAAAGIALAVNSSGATHTQTGVLLTPQEVDGPTQTPFRIPTAILLRRQSALMRLPFNQRVRNSFTS